MNDEQVIHRNGRRMQSYDNERVNGSPIRAGSQEQNVVHSQFFRIGFSYGLKPDSNLSFLANVVAELSMSISLAEGVGFEPTLGSPLSLISSQVPSTTQPPFRCGVH